MLLYVRYMTWNESTKIHLKEFRYIHLDTLSLILLISHFLEGMSPTHGKSHENDKINSPEFHHYSRESWISTKSLKEKYFSLHLTVSIKAFKPLNIHKWLTSHYRIAIKTSTNSLQVTIAPFRIREKTWNIASNFLWLIQ